ncbi:MAG: methylase [Woeseia sp.]|nr:methylase [Woeseia sp.]
MKPDAPATRRNRDAILTVLKTEFVDATSVLEIGSGTGQHAVYFGGAMPNLEWQTSDRSENHEGISLWLADKKLSNVKPPLTLDVTTTNRVSASYDAIFSANTAHIMSFSAVKKMFRLIGETLQAHGVFCLYGPFNVGGKFTSKSNEEFNQMLKRQNPEMGIRDLETLNELALENGLIVGNRYAMPANNMIVIWRQGARG